MTSNSTPADVTDRDSIAAAADRVRQELGTARSQGRGDQGRRRDAKRRSRLGSRADLALCATDG
jgi:hypothetical protein